MIYIKLRDTWISGYKEWKFDRERQSACCRDRSLLYLVPYNQVHMHMWVLTLSSTVCNPMDYSLPGSSVHGIYQARLLEWVAISSSRGSSQPRDWTCASCVFSVGRQILYHCTTCQVALTNDKDKQCLIFIKCPLSFCSSYLWKGLFIKKD